MFWLETWWKRACYAVQQWFLLQHGLFLNILSIFPPTKWLVAEAGAAALKTLVFKSRSVLQTFCSFPQFEEIGTCLGFFHFPLPPFFLFSCPSPWQSWLFYSYFNTALILPCLISQGNEEAHHTTLRMQFPANCVLLNCPLKIIICKMDYMPLCSRFQKHLWVLEALRQLSSTFSGFNSFTCSGSGAARLYLITWKVTLAALPIKLSVLVKQLFFLRFLFD